MTATGTTRTGFAYKVDLEVFDDMDVLEGLADVDEGKVLRLPKVATAILGKKQFEALKKHLKEKSEDGVAHVGAFRAEFVDIMTGHAEIKK